MKISTKGRYRVINEYLDGITLQDLAGRQNRAAQKII